MGYKMNVCKGGCHCGQVKFEVDVSNKVKLSRCNCSICRMSGYLHLIVEADRFRLLSGKQSLSDYRFNTGAARHLFCRHCGIKSFYVPRSHPDGISVNANCVGFPENIELSIQSFDGQNWQASREGLPPTDQ